MTAGRPTKYNPDQLDHITQLCMLGATDEELAKFLDVNTDTIYNWKKKHPEFVEAIKKGREYADIEVAKSLFSKACAGDVTAMIFWLKNRRPDQWRDQKNIKHEHEFKSKITQAQETLEEKLNAAFASETSETSNKPH